MINLSMAAVVLIISLPLVMVASCSSVHMAERVFADQGCRLKTDLCFGCTMMCAEGIEIDDISIESDAEVEPDVLKVLKK